MSRKQHTAEQIIGKLPFGFAQGGEPAEPREAEVELAQGARREALQSRVSLSL